MMVILNSDQLLYRSEYSNKYRIVKNSCCVGELKLNYEQFTQIVNCKDKTFEILVNFGGSQKDVKLSRCVRCAWGRVNKDGFSYMQINYWESELVDTDVSRDILIESLGI
jgi:hypothetical protein